MQLALAASCISKPARAVANGMFFAKQHITGDWDRRLIKVLPADEDWILNFRVDRFVRGFRRLLVGI